MLAVIIFVLLLIILNVVVLILFWRNKKRADEAEIQLKNLEAKLSSTGKELQQSNSTKVQILQSKSLSQQIIDQLDEGIIYVDSTGIIQFINRQGEQLVGKTDTDMIGKRFTEVFSLTFVQMQSSLIEQALGGNSFSLPIGTQLGSLHGKIPVGGVVVPIKSDHQVSGIVITLRNITEQLQKEAEVKAFFSAAAHELRSPLTVIRSVLSLIIENFDRMEKEKTLKFLIEANQTSEWLMELTNNFLSITKIEQGGLDLKKETFDLIALTKEVVSEYSLLAKNKKLYLNHDLGSLGLPKVMADKNKTKEILGNLLSNALKYTPQGGITISHQGENSHITTRVTDTGVGIDKENQSLLFRRFQQVGNSRSQPQSKSSGLGLYLARKLAEIMSGGLQLEKSEPGAGSTFKFWLPRA